MNEPTLEELIKLNSHLIKDGEKSILHCPHCHSEFIHQQEVHVFNRIDEDLANTRSSMKNCSGEPLEEILPDKPEPLPTPKNPSKRRQGLSIDFCCESCHKLSRLLIAQHKGQTFLNWENTTFSPVRITPL